ncbi:hypothetical protein Esti_004504 [Eimeria stiedai]
MEEKKTKLSKHWKQPDRLGLAVAEDALLRALRSVTTAAPSGQHTAPPTATRGTQRSLLAFRFCKTMHYEARTVSVSPPHLERQSGAAREEGSWRVRGRSRRPPRSLSLHAALFATAVVAAVFLIVQCTRSLGSGREGERLFARRLASLEGDECRVAGRPRSATREQAQLSEASGLIVQLQQLSLGKADAELLTRGERSRIDAAERKVRRLNESVSRLELVVSTLNEEVIRKEKKLNFELAAISKGAPIPELLLQALRSLAGEKNRLAQLMVEQQEKEMSLATMHYRSEQAVLAMYIRAKKKEEGEPISAAAAAALAAADAVGMGTKPIKGSELLMSLSPSSRELLPFMLEELQAEAERLFKDLYISFLKKDKPALAHQVWEAQLLLKQVDAIVKAYSSTSLKMPSSTFERAMQRLRRKTLRVNAFLREGERRRLGLPPAFEALAAGAEAPHASTGHGAADSETSSSDEDGGESGKVGEPADAQDSVEAKVGAMVEASAGSAFKRQEWMLQLVRPGDDSGLTVEDHEKVNQAKEYLASLSKSEQELRERVKLLTEQVKLEGNALNDLVAALPPGEPIPKMYLQMQSDIEFVKKWLEESRQELEQVGEKMRAASYGTHQQALCALISARRRLIAGAPLAPFGAAAVGAALVALGEASSATLPVPTETEAKAIRESLLEVSERIKLRSTDLKRKVQSATANDVKFANMIAEEAMSLAQKSELLLGDTQEADAIRKAVAELKIICEESQVRSLTRRLTDVANVARIVEPARKEPVHPMQLEAVYVDRLHVVAEAQTCNITCAALSDQDKITFMRALSLNRDHLLTLQKMLVPVWVKRCEGLVASVLKASQGLHDAEAKLTTSHPPPSEASGPRKSTKKGKQQVQQQRQLQTPSLLPLVEKVVGAVEMLMSELATVGEELKILIDMKKLMPFPAEVDTAIKRMERVAEREKMHAETTANLVSQVLTSDLNRLLRASGRPSRHDERKPSLRETRLSKEQGKPRVTSLTEDPGISLKTAARETEELVSRLVKAGVDGQVFQSIMTILDIILEGAE